MKIAPKGLYLCDYTEAEILERLKKAISLHRWHHTLGGADMTPLDALIYVSDFIEPGRRRFPGLDQVRELAETDIFAAMRLSAKLSNDYLTSRGKQPHPKTIAIATGGEAQ